MDSRAPAVAALSFQGASATELRWKIRELGLWMFLGTVVMLFAAFTSALVVRKSGSDWQVIELPPILWLNTALIVLSSATLEVARRAGRSAPRVAAACMGATAVFGLVFLAGQLEAWRALAQAGVLLPSSPASGFFYILTGAHGAHLLAALTVLGVLVARTLKRIDAPEWPLFAGLASTFWHFLTLVWLYLFVVLRYV